MALTVTAQGLGQTDWKKVGKGLLIALAGAALTYLTTVVTNTSFGAYTPLVYAGWSTLTNIVLKSLDGVKS